MITAEGKVKLTIDKQPKQLFMAQTCLSASHPYGQWSLGIEPTSEVTGMWFNARLTFLSHEAPHKRLKPGAKLALYRGRERIGTAEVTRRASP